MKTINKLLGLILCMSITSGCSDFVDFDPHDAYIITEADYLRTEEDYRKMVISSYTPLQWIGIRTMLSDVATDDAVSGGGGPTNGHIDDFDNYAVNPTNMYIEELWQSAYEGINRVNYLMQYKEKNLAGETINFSGKEILYGELYFLRAYYYFSLVTMYGDAVLFTDRKLGVSDFGTLQRKPKAEVYTQIENDLKAAIAVPLPTKATEAGRITLYAAKAMLAKVYLYQNKMAECAQILEDVESWPFELVKDFGSQFVKSGENGPESVFEIQYSNKSPYWNWGGQLKGQGNYMAFISGPRGMKGSDNMPYAWGEGMYLPTKKLYDAFDNLDQRKAASILDIEAYKVANPTLNVEYTGSYKQTGYYNKKYLPIKGESSGQIELNYDNNIRIIRFSDILLMAAEANLETVPAKSQKYLNMVRDRAFGDQSHRVTVSKQAILEERRLEFALEGHRFWDLVRTGNAATNITKFKTGKNEVFPIPAKEIEISKLSQNPNW